MIKNKRGVFFIQQHESFIYIIFFLQSHSSLHVKNTTIVSFFWGFFYFDGYFNSSYELYYSSDFLSMSICCFHMRILLIYACYLEPCYHLNLFADNTLDQ